MPDLIHSIQISAAPEAIDSLVSTAEGFAAWWAFGATELPGFVELGFFNRQTVYRLRQVAHEPLCRVAWLCETGEEWAGTGLTFALEARPGGTQLRFTHAGWRSETGYFVSCNTVWGALMLRLKAAAEGKSPGPLFLKDAMGY